MKERGGGREGIRRGRGIKGNERWKQGKRREGRRDRGIKEREGWVIVLYHTLSPRVIKSHWLMLMECYLGQVLPNPPRWIVKIHVLLVVEWVYVCVCVCVCVSVCVSVYFGMLCIIVFQFAHLQPQKKCMHEWDHNKMCCVCVCVCGHQCTHVVHLYLCVRLCIHLCAYCWLRARRALTLPNDVQLRTRRVLSLYKVSGDSALLVLNGTSLKSVKALLALSRRHVLNF